MELISFEQMLKIVKKEYPDARNVWPFDKQYCVGSKEWYEDVLNRVPPIDVPFKEEVFDCEDFAMAMTVFVKMEVASELSHSLAFGEALVDGARPTPHTLNILITDKMEVLFYEPQVRQFVDGRDFKPFFVRI